MCLENTASDLSLANDNFRCSLKCVDNVCVYLCICLRVCVCVCVYMCVFVCSVGVCVLAVCTYMHVCMAYECTGCTVLKNVCMCL